MIEIKRILAPTDFSPHAEEALHFACDLAQKLGASLDLLHVLPEVVPVVADLSVAASLPPDYYEEAEEQANQSLAGSLKPGWSKPSEVKTAVRWGGAVEAICQYAQEQGVDLVVIATHGRTGLSHVLLGSVAERIVRESPCPVLTLRDHSTDRKTHSDKPTKA